MKHLIKLTDYSISDLRNIFMLADELKSGNHKNSLTGKSIVLFFPSSSIRTRVTFEKGIYLLNGQPILFPSDSLDKKEKIEDVAGYLNNWADCVVIRHGNIDLINQFSKHSKVPVINAMTKINHPCEVLSDLYAISKRRNDYMDLTYTFVGINTNIGKAWAESAKAFGLKFIHCCPIGYEIENVNVEHDVKKAISQSDIILTDSISEEYLKDFIPYQITLDLMRLAKPNALLSPCQPFTRGEEVSADVIDSEFFVGYEFKESLLYIQQVIILYGMRGE
jgi:ornithine carbamoyltransferase